MAPNNENQYDTEVYAGDAAERARRTQMHMPDEDRTTRTEMQQSITDSQSERLDDGVRMGEDRAIGDVPNWEAYDSQQLYDFATQENSPGTADNLGVAFTDGGNRLAEAANGLLDAVTKLEGAWSGDASDSARAALAPLAKAAGGAGQTAQMMGVQMSKQSTAAQEVAKLPPPQTFNKQAALEQMASAGLSEMTPDMKAAQDAADETKRQQVGYLNTYTSTMSAVDAETPSFIPPPPGEIKSGGSGGVPLSGGGVGPLGPGGVPNSSTTPGPTGGFVGIDPQTGADAGFSDGDYDDPIGGVSVPGGGTGAAGYTPTSSAPLSAPGLGGGGAPVHSGPAAGAGGFGSAFGNFGGPGGGAGGPGSGAGGQGQGGRGGGPAGAVPPAGAAGRPGAGRGMGAGAPGGKGRKEEDEEHERPAFLVEGDPDATFGSDEMTAPPVIGGGDED